MPVAEAQSGCLHHPPQKHHVGVWKVDDDQPAAVIDGLPKGVYNLDFSDDGKLLAMGAADGRVRVWRL